MRPEFRADNPTVLMVPYVIVTMEAQHPIPPLVLHYLLRESVFYRPSRQTLGYKAYYDMIAGGRPRRLKGPRRGPDHSPLSGSECKSTSLLLHNNLERGF